MNTADHNNNAKTPANGIRTIGDLRDYISTCNIPAWEIRQICSALKRADELIGHGGLDLPADPAMIMELLEKFSAAMAGMEEGAWGNLKSRVRKAFRLAEPRLAAAAPANRPPLTPVWKVFEADLRPKEQRPLSRLIHYASAQGWLPEELSDEHLKRFGSQQKDEALAGDMRRILQSTVAAWNRVAERHPDRMQRLTPPPPKRVPYWIPEDRWPEGLRKDRDAFLQHLSKPSTFTSDHAVKLKAGTIAQYDYAVTTLVSAIVAEGVPLDSLTSLAAAATADNLDKALLFLHARTGGRVTRTMVALALKIRTIAIWCNADPGELKVFDQLCTSMQKQRPARGMTAKNRALLDKLEEDRFRDIIQLLPSLIVKDVKKSLRTAEMTGHGKSKKVRMDRLAAKVRVALALELLLLCGVRRENLVSLELGKSLRKIGESPNSYWVIALEEDEVKNEEPLRFKLEGETVALLEWYLSEWRTILCKTPGPWLFPVADGSRIGPRSLAEAIRRTAIKFLGQPITPHQFRHISAELYLLDDPDGIYTVSQHLGHRDPNTTRMYYARPKQREASRHFQSKIVLKREGARNRWRSRRRRKDSDP